MSRIVVIDDERPMRRALTISLRAHGFEVEGAETGEEGLRLAASWHPDLVVLDLGLPGMDGLDVIEGLRGWTTVPIVVLSARDQERDKVTALEIGADDYVTKPFGMAELVARIRAALRRAEVVEEDPVVTTPDFVIDLAAKVVTRAGERVHLTPTEWGMLECLVRNAGRLVTQRQVLETVWGPEYVDETAYLRTYMASLRRKLEPEPGKPRYLLTEPGMGYRFRPGADPKPSPASSASPATPTT